MFEGSYVALVTTFKDGAVDKEAYRKLIEFQIESGIDGIVPCGCTGEAATLSHEEQIDLMKFAVDVAGGRVKIMAGSGSNNTEEALRLTKAAKEAGCDGALLITPYYNKPTQEGLCKHYEKIACNVDIPLCLYNVPGRTGVSLLPETVARLSEIESITAIKEASGSLDQVSSILAACDIEVLSGDDSLTLPMMVIGAKGVISVAANIVPEDVTAMVHAAAKENWAEAARIHHKLFPLCKAMFIETNPLPVKASMKIMGMINGQLRLPLCEAKEETFEKLENVLKNYGLEVSS